MKNKDLAGYISQLKSAQKSTDEIKKILKEAGCVIMDSSDPGYLMSIEEMDWACVEGEEYAFMPHKEISLGNLNRTVLEIIIGFMGG